MTVVSAREIGEDRKIGSIKAGKQADLVVMDKEWNIVSVIRGGQFVR
ncbi:amidohydrolase family protein [Caproicibacterium sp. XB2]|uniref:Amidohydrolase family protein n=1 Tax=Caproicibacterium lactatifermentans TaxID=2666138 RepID=A0A859DS63_9FIRM|nr:amidohydrolase family protein [Caproicibacterium lactatifermentans]QKN24768.1 amidohydrolase family protein [Caproicibacterium lactatifermentans]